MTDEYQPTRKEVFGEMMNGVRQYFNGDRLNKLKQTGVNFLGLTGVISLGPYILPTTIRLFKYEETSSSEESSEEIKLDATHHVGFSAGFFAGIGLDIAQVMGYSYAVEQDHPEALLIPVVTNVASGVYEVGRSMYKNARQRILEKHKTEGLEATLQE